MDPARRAVACGFAASLLLGSSATSAHPLGASSINRYLDFQYVGGGRFRVAYVLDFAEGPAYAEIDALDADHDGAVTPTEQRRYLASRLPVLVSTCVVEIDGERAAPYVVASNIETPPGEGGLQTLRIVAELAVEGRAPSGGHDLALRVHDDGFAGVPGWREIHAEDTLARDAAPSALAASDAGPSPARVVDARFVLPSRAPDVAGVRSTPRRWLGLVAIPALLLLAAIGVVVARRRP
jgi:hypothetical protein